MISTKLIPDDYNFDGVSLITGFHGIGSTGYLAIKHIIQTLNLNPTYPINIIIRIFNLAICHI